MELSYKFRPIEPRSDTEDIKENCHRDSVQTKEGRDSWNTLYNDSYVRHPLDLRQPAGSPKPGIHIGGGNFSASRDEMTNSLYRHSYSASFDRSAFPERSGPMPNSEFMPNEANGRLESTARSAMEESGRHIPTYDNTEARERAHDGRTAHFFFGDKKPRFDTNYSLNFKRPIAVEENVIDTDHFKRSSLEFDSKAGLGPHARSLLKKEKFPEVPDAQKPDPSKKNFDLGYDRLNYSTTMLDGLQIGKNGGPRPESFKAPPCAKLSDHGMNSSEWISTVKADFQNRKGVPNSIDQDELKKTHWTTGNDPENWERHQWAVAKEVPKHAYDNLQNSNPVFRGNGEMTFNTTSGDMLGCYDKNYKPANDEFLDARADHLFLGGDKRNFRTTAGDANALAGQGKPADKAPNIHLLKGTRFALGGAWDRLHEARTDIIEDNHSPGYRPGRVDGSYNRQTHFELDATVGNKGMYETTYFEEICRPKIY